MAATKITDLVEVTIVDGSNDFLTIVDISDTTMAGSGSTKKVLPYNLPVSSGTQTALDNKITGLSSSTSGVMPLFDGTTGKLLKEYTGTGIVKVTSGIVSTVAGPVGTIIGTTDTQTLSNKRINSRVFEVASTGTATPDVSTTDDYIVTALATGITFAAPTGTPLQGQKLFYRVTANGTPQTMAWNSIYRAIGVTLPTVTTASGVTYIGLKQNSTDARWDVLAVGSGT